MFGAAKLFVITSIAGKILSSQKCMKSLYLKIHFLLYDAIPEPEGAIT